MRIDHTELARIQRWMQSVITHPAGVPAGLAAPTTREVMDVMPDELENVICSSATQTSIERLDVYAHAYFARLLEVLAAEYPATVYAVGEELFRKLAFGYLQHYPSQSYTLADLGSNFAAYLAQTRPPRDACETEPDWADFLVDLAKLERVYSEVFDGPGVEGQRLLRAEDLREITPGDWLGVRLAVVPCLKLIELRFPVHDYITGNRQQACPDIPPPSPTWLVVTRRDFVVRRAAVSSTEFLTLAVLVGGGTIADSLELAESHWPGEFADLAGEVQKWFRDWSAAGYFRALTS